MKLDIDHARRLFEDRLRRRGQTVSPLVGLRGKRIEAAMTVTALVYEKQLAREGLAPIDVARGGGIMSDKGEGHHLADPSAADAREVYLAWTRAVLEEPRNFFGGRAGTLRYTWRSVWKLHAQGKSNAQAAAILGTSRARIEQALRFVRARAGDPPVVNPWRQSGRDGAKTTRPRAQGEHMADKETEKAKAVTWGQYTRIILRSDAGVNVPGQRDTCEFIDVEARLTPMGMEVKLPDKGYVPFTDGDGKVTKVGHPRPLAGATLLINIPAWKITQADRVVDGR